MFWKILLSVYIFFCIGALSGFLKAFSYSKRYAKEQIQRGKHWSSRAKRMNNTFCSFLTLTFLVLCPIINAFYFLVLALGGDILYDTLEEKVDEALIDNIEEDF